MYIKYEFFEKKLKKLPFVVDAVEMSEVKRLASVRHLGHLRQEVGDKVKFRHLPQEGQVEFVGDLKSLMLWVDL